MSAKSEALRLADALDELDRQFSRNGLCGDAAAELRRLHAENEAYGVHLSERMKDLAKVEAQRDALLEALKGITGHINERFSGGVWDRARAAIKAVEENT